MMRDCAMFHRQDSGARRPWPACIDGPRRCRSTKKSRPMKARRFVAMQFLVREKCCGRSSGGRKRCKNFSFSFATNNGGPKRGSEREREILHRQGRRREGPARAGRDAAEISGGEKGAAFFAWPAGGDLATAGESNWHVSGASEKIRGRKTCRCDCGALRHCRCGFAIEDAGGG